MKNTKLAQARLAACRLWPAATSAILSLIPVERRELGTLAVDKHWRLYFDPEYLLDPKTCEPRALLVVGNKQNNRRGVAPNLTATSILLGCFL